MRCGRDDVTHGRTCCMPVRLQTATAAGRRCCEVVLRRRAPVAAAARRPLHAARVHGRARTSQTAPGTLPAVTCHRATGSTRRLPRQMTTMMTTAQSVVIYSTVVQLTTDRVQVIYTHTRTRCPSLASSPSHLATTTDNARPATMAAS